MLTGVGAVVNTAQVHAGATVAVIGLGGVGLASLLGAVAAGARESSPWTCPTTSSASPASSARPHTFNAARPETVQSRSAKRPSGGVEYAFELAGSIRAFETAYRITRRGGTTVTAGLPPSDRDDGRCPPSNLVAEERTIKGSYIGTCVPSATSRATSTSTSAAGCRSTG